MVRQSYWFTLVETVVKLYAKIACGSYKYESSKNQQELEIDHISKDCSKHINKKKIRKKRKKKGWIATI